LPDADRLISRFAGTQFLLEGLSTSMLLTADLRTHTLATAATNASSTAGMSYGTGTADGLANSSATTVLDHSSSAAATAEALRMVTALQSAAFALSLLALAVPITQLLEQRCVTPTYATASISHHLTSLHRAHAQRSRQPARPDLHRVTLARHSN
jgi:hypothetical protein